MPREFIHTVVGPLNKFKEPRVTAEGLEKFKVTITTMDFASGKVNARCRALLKLPDTRDIESALLKAKPWIGYDGSTSFSNLIFERYITDNPRPGNYHRCAASFSTVLNVWVTNSGSACSRHSLLGRTSWRELSNQHTLRWLGVETDDYIWYPDGGYHNFKADEEGDEFPKVLDPEKPHAICYIVDSTPFEGLDQGTLRTSELKAIVIVAIYNHVLPEYNHLDSFGVTVISFWDRDIRIVQGLVNFDTLDVDIRVTEPQRFHEGFRGEDGSIDERFLTLLAYNSADVLPLPKY